MKINPLFITGNWTDGRVLDRHVVSSEFDGYDQWGHERYKNTVYTELGLLLNEFKYHNEYGNKDEIVLAVADFIAETGFASDVGFIVPAPPSNRNRDYQPVFEIAQGVSDRLGIDYRPILVRNDTRQAKNTHAVDVHKDISLVGTLPTGATILIIDDLYSTGRTLSCCVNILRNDLELSNIYVLALTRTRLR